MEKNINKTKIETKGKRLDDEAQNEMIIKIRKQQQLKNNIKQPAQDRLKRLQTKLKQVDNNKKQDNGTFAPRTKNSASSAPVTTSSQLSVTVGYLKSPVTSVIGNDSSKQSSCLQKSPNNFLLPDKSKHVQSASTIYSISKRDFDRNNNWAKPKALLDASNRLDSKRSISANQRLSLLRDSLQQQHHQSETTNITNNNKSSSYTVLRTTTKRSSQQSGPSAPKIIKINPLPAMETSNDELEPMDIDNSHEQLENVACINTMSANTNESFNQTLEGDKSDVQILLSNGQQLPKRLMDHMYFVLDTNVLMENLVFVDDLSRLALDETKGSMLYIPYIVIKELDNLKNKHNVDDIKRKMAIRAIRYLNQKFDSNLKIQAQSALEEADHFIDVDCGDDSIVNCCLQLKDQVPNLMLVTNDANLRLKSHASFIKVSCRADLISKYREKFDALLS